MSGHDTAHASGNRGAKGNELQMLQALAVRGNHRQIDVRIRSGVTVSREMFRGSQRSVVFGSFHERGHKFRDALRILSERPRIDDRIPRIVVYVGIRRVDPVDPSGARLQRRNFPHGVRVFRIARGGHRHRGGKRSAFVVTHGGSAFEISADKQW